MRGLIAAILAGLGSAGDAKAAEPSTAELMATPRAFMIDLMSDKMDAAAALTTSDLTVVDEFAPYSWTGAGAFEHWIGDYGAWLKASRITRSKVKLGDPIHVESHGDTAYVVAAASETFRMDGKPMAETARMAFALRRDGGTWKIVSTVWAARTPHLVGAGAAKKPT